MVQVGADPGLRASAPELAGEHRKSFAVLQPSRQDRSATGKASSSERLIGINSSPTGRGGLGCAKQKLCELERTALLLGQNRWPSIARSTASAETPLLTAELLTQGSNSRAFASQTLSTLESGEVALSLVIKPIAQATRSYARPAEFVSFNDPLTRSKP